MFKTYSYRTILTVSGALAATCGHAHAEDFSGAWGLDQWSTSGILDGETSIAPVVARVRGTYEVNLGNPGPGVTQRSVSYSVVAAHDGRAWLDWSWEGFHAFASSNGGLQLFASGPEGDEVIDLVAYGNVSAPFSFAGDSASIEIHAGFPFGVIVTGENFDSNSTLNGIIDLRGLIVGGEDALIDGFVDDYAPENWTDSGIEGGVTSLSQGLDLPADAAVLCYDVDLGAPGSGVTYREAAFTVAALEDGVVSFDWTYEGFHAFFQSFATLRIEVDGPNGVEVIELVPLEDSPATFSYAGEASFTVYAGDSFSIIAGGANGDSNSTLEGCVTLSCLDIDPLPAADPCPADLDGDGMVNAADLAALLAGWGACP